MSQPEKRKNNGQIKVGYIIKLAFRNIVNYKKHMAIIVFGFTISIAVLLSINIWAVKSEQLAINGFLVEQDYQAYIYSAQHPEYIDEIIEELDNDTLVDYYNTAFVSYALFNTENKNPTEYVCLPEASQNQTDPVSITNAFIANQETLNRIKFLFNVEGNFTVEDNGVILSQFQADELSAIYDTEINIGSTLNVSIGKYIPNPAYGFDKIADFNPTFFESYTVTAIYTPQESISIIQEALDIDILSDSIIFPLEDIIPADIEEMNDKSVPYLLFIKFDQEVLTKDGIENVVEKMQDFKTRIFAGHNVYIKILDSPIISLLNAYTRASVTIVFMMPVILVGIILTIFMVNIVVASRQEEVNLLRDRGADSPQIVLLFSIEFLIVAVTGVIFGIIIAILLAALIPSFSSQGFQGDVFREFIKLNKYDYKYMILVPLGLVVGILAYAIFKIIWEISLRNKDYTSGESQRKRIQRNIFVSTNIALAITITIALIFSIIDSARVVISSQNFSIGNSATSGYTFVLFCFMLIFAAQGISFLITEKFMSKIKGLYKRLIFNDAFFLINNFKRKNKKLSTMTFSLVIVSSLIVFSLTAAASISNNQMVESDFKNGADLRIVTYPVDYSFSNNISQVDGVNEVVSIFKTKGAIPSKDYTVYGVDPVKYSRIGEWDKSCFPGGSNFSILTALEANPEGVIIGTGLSESLNVTIGDWIPVYNIASGILYRSFTVVGIINSAPGLGLADGQNIEMLQPNEGFILINADYMVGELSITNCQLFLASILPGENLATIEGGIEELLPNIQVNPVSVNEQFMGDFIEKYIPNVLTFFWIGLIAIIIIIIVLLVMFTDFTLSQRTQEFAISLSMGASRNTIAKLILTEVVVIILSACMGGILLGIGFTYSTFYLLTPILTSHNMIPFSVVIPIWQLVILPIIMTIVALVGVLPSIVKYGQEKIINTLRA
ncbi:MAG: FtsX-like permease family protein [Candidatus Heimdallarchaeota archaeon]